YGTGSDGETTANRVEVTLSSDARVDLSKFQRAAAAHSSCGVCGRASIESVHARGLTRLTSDVALDAAVLINLPSALRSSQRVFGRTGGLHGAALFDRAGSTIAVCEDIGRHNAVDKVIGRALLTDQVPLSN